MRNKSEILENIISLVEEYALSQSLETVKYSNGDRIPYASIIHDKQELLNILDSALNIKFCAGKYADIFERRFAEYLGVKYAYAVNSGSSANLLAFMALTSHLLGDRAIKRGDEVITVAVAFPTTVSPIIQYGAIPVFVDITIPEYNIDISLMKKALSKKTKAVMIAHTLGVPFDLKAVNDFCKGNNLWLIEDNCDALGSEVMIDGKYFKTGSVGDIGTSSFYPPHHMTMGEGGAVYTSNPLLAKIILSLRDWGRDCICPPGKDNICQHRFDVQHGELPIGYDHKYVYSHFGYNMKVTDIQAGIGCAQLSKLEGFIAKRIENFNLLFEGLKDLEEDLIFTHVKKDILISPFGFIMTIRKDSEIERKDLIEFIEKRGVQTRTVFAGNIIRQPCFDSIRNSEAYRTCGELNNTDLVMNNTFWIGVSPGIKKDEIEWMITSIRAGVKECKRAKLNSNEF